MDRYRNEWIDNKEQLIEGKKKRVNEQRKRDQQKDTEVYG